MHMTLQQQKHSLRTLQLFTLCLIIFIDSFCYFLTLPIILKLIYQYKSHYLGSHVSLSMQDWLYGILLSLGPLASFITSPLIGGFSDQYGRKKLMFITLGLSVFAYALYLYGIAFQYIFFIILAKLFSGVATKSQPIAEAAITDLYQKHERTYKISLIAFSMTLAMTLGPIVGSYLSDPKLSSLFTLNFPIYIGLSLSVISLFLLSLVFKETHQVSKVKISISRSMLQLFQQRQLRNYFICFFCLQASWALFYQYVSLYLIQQFHISINQSTILLTVFGGIMAFGLFVIYYYLSKYFKLWQITKACFLLAFIFSIFFIVSDELTYLYLWGSLYALVIGLYYPALVTLMTYEVESNQVGMLMGCNTMLMVFAWFITSLIIGALASIDMYYPFLVQLILIFISLPVFFYQRTSQQKNSLMDKNYEQ